MAKYRSKLQIIADVTGVVNGGAKKTEIMYQANLSYKLLTRYLKAVIDMGLVQMRDGNTYDLTEKGMNFLREFKGYYERRMEAEKKLSGVKDERAMLVDRFLNSEHMKATFSNNCIGKKDEKEKVSK
ncbi:MAG: hypothetical protein JSV58_06945 [Candidatus Bathyarchaeota archaeon]|nr:MAG: hypothetical protein JSV58_06945 [Candidatus Bathyarchaeota archaeon]